MQCCKTETLRFRDRRNGTKSLFLFSIPPDFLPEEREALLAFVSAGIRCPKGQGVLFPLLHASGIEPADDLSVHGIGLSEKSKLPVYLAAKTLYPGLFLLYLKDNPTLASPRLLVNRKNGWRNGVDPNGERSQLARPALYISLFIVPANASAVAFYVVLRFICNRLL